MIDFDYVKEELEAAAKQIEDIWKEIAKLKGVDRNYEEETHEKEVDYMRHVMAPLLLPLEISTRIAGLPEDEKKLMIRLLDRLDKGREEYGEWSVDDIRTPEEILEEVIDAMHYCAMLLVKIESKKAGEV